MAKTINTYSAIHRDQKRRAVPATTLQYKPLDGSATRIKRAAPVIPFEKVHTAGPGGRDLILEVGPPHGNPADVRSAQRLSVLVGTSRALYTYHDILGYVKEEEKRRKDAESTDATLRLAAQSKPALHSSLFAGFKTFLHAVDTCIPYDITNLVHDIGSESVAKVLACSVRSIEERIRHRTPWCADELGLLKLVFPTLDVEASCQRQAYWRAFLKIGLWKDRVDGIPRPLIDYGKRNGLVSSTDAVFDQVRNIEE